MAKAYPGQIAPDHPGPIAYVRGEVLPGWRGPVSEGPCFQIDRTGVTLVHFFVRPTPREVRGARGGKARFALVRGGMHTLDGVADALVQASKGTA